MKAQQESQLELTGVVRNLLEFLEQGDQLNAYQLLNEVNRIKDQTLYYEIGKMTRGLHNAIVNFNIKDNDAKDVDDEDSQKLNASDRLNFVIETTENAANKTMDMVEATVPISENLGDRARDLKSTWAKLIKRELSAGEFRDLYAEMENFLDETIDHADLMNENLNNILLAQDFQDITGQVIKKVIALVQDVQDNLVDLVKLAASLQTFTGNDVDAQLANMVANVEEDELEGPIINKDARDDIVSNQDEVDDLLSSLGF